MHCRLAATASVGSGSWELQCHGLDFSFDIFENIRNFSTIQRQEYKQNPVDGTGDGTKAPYFK